MIQSVTSISVMKKCAIRNPAGGTTKTEVSKLTRM
jgi:hypothetical protein